MRTTYVISQQPNGFNILTERIDAHGRPRLVVIARDFPTAQSAQEFLDTQIQAVTG